MQRLARVALLLAACSGCTARTGDGAPPAQTQPRAIVLVTVDGVSARELSAFGGARPTPALLDLVTNGSGWPDAWTTTPMTRPAVATYLTGLAPDRHGVTDDLFVALGDQVPTLASELAGAGYRTAAFPDSSFLGPASGLLRGFEVSGDTPPVPVQPWRWLPYIRPAADVATDFESWLGTLAPGTRYFAWLHFSQPLNDEIGSAMQPLAQSRRKAKAKAAPATERNGVEKVDEAIGRILAGLRARGDFGDALIAVAGTMGDARGLAGEAPGAGMSLAPPAIAVPIVIKLPGGARSPRGPDGALWAPDVPATIAERAGLRLDPGAEGVSLEATAPADRVRIAWSWAPRDQLGLAPARVATTGGTTVAEGPAGASAEPASDAAAAERLAGALAARLSPAPLGIPLDRAREVLSARGLAAAEDGNAPRTMDAAARREVAERLLVARFMLKAGMRREALAAFRDAFEHAPDLPATRLDYGHALVLTEGGKEEAIGVLRRGVELYPTDPEMWHWYAHAIWKDSWQEAEAVLREILPYRPGEGDVLYDLACTRSLAGDLDESAAFLRRSIEAGFQTWGTMETDPDLRALRESGRFAEVLKEYRQ